MSIKNIKFLNINLIDILTTLIYNRVIEERRGDYMNRIKELRKLYGIKQNDLCSQLDISQGTLSGWENSKYEPDLNAINKMCDIFHVTSDYLLCRTDWSICSICHSEYDPLNKHDAAAHDAFHEKFISAQNKYGEILLYVEADTKRNDCIYKLNNPTLSKEERIVAFEDYLKYDFMLSLWKSSFDLNHETFDTFCQKEMGLATTKEVLDNIGTGVYQQLVDKYGIADDIDYHKIVQFNSKDFTDDAQLISIDIQEKDLVMYYRRLNSYGKKKLIENAEDLLQLEKYTSIQVLNAAHERTDIDIPENADTTDNDIMDDENF